MKDAKGRLIAYWFCLEVIITLKTAWFWQSKEMHKSKNNKIMRNSLTERSMKASTKMRGGQEACQKGPENLGSGRKSGTETGNEHVESTSRAVHKIAKRYNI